MTQHSSGSNRHIRKIKNAKHKIGGNSRQRSTRAKVRSNKPQRTGVPQADIAHTRNANEIPYKGLRGCASVEAVAALHGKWFSKFNGKALKGLGKRVSPANRAIVEALLTRSGATSIPRLTSESICGESYKLLHASLMAALNATLDLEFALVTFVSGDGETSHFQTEIELHQSQKRVQATLRAMAPNFFGISEVALFNSQGHPAGGQMLQDHQHALVWGPPETVARAQDVAIKHAPKYTPNFSGAPVIDIRRVAANEVNLARVSAYLFKPPYKCLNWNPGKDGKRGFINGSEKGDRHVRYLRLAQIRTMLPFEDTCFGSGDGQRIRSEIIKFARALAMKDTANGQAIIHPDAIASFWVALMPQIKADRWNLPVIKTQK